LLRNVAGTFNGSFTNTNTADRIYTLQNRAGTLADDTDLALKANLASPTFTGTVAGITATMVGLGNVSNTSNATERAATRTLTNARITRRVATVTQAAAPAMNTDNMDIAQITGLAQAITSMTSGLTGTPSAGDYLTVQITDNGTARAITWGASFASSTANLPTTTEISVMLRVGFQRNHANTIWDCIAAPIPVSGSGDMILASAQTNTGVKTFNATTLLLRNVAGTFNGSFTNTNTADRIYTLKDAAGTIAFTSDITGTNSGTNTGDQTITLTGGVTGSGTGSFAATVVTNANLTGIVTSTGNATAIADAALSIAKTSGLQAAIDLKANLASPTFTGTVAGITASMVGLGNVTNTSDSAKPVSTAQQTALDLKANLASPTFTGTVVTPSGIAFIAPVLGTPASGTLTNCTGLLVSGIVNSTSLALGLGTIELGHASDTTLSRSAAGVLAVEGVVIPTISSTNTITGKRNQSRTNSTTHASTLTPDLSEANIYFRTTQTGTLTINATIGTPVIGETIAIFVSSVAAQTLTINANYVVYGAAFPATTTAGKTFFLTGTFNGTVFNCLWSNQV